MSLMGFIPPVAHVITRAQAVMADPDAGMKDLAQVIETDPGITARALKVANSAYYGLSGKVTSITHASVLLGNKILGEIITMAGIRGFLGETLKGYGLESGILWRHSLAVAMGSRLIAEKRRAGLAEDAFVGGLIHDAGMIMLDSHLFERKEEFQAIIEDGSHSFLEGERMALGIDHSEVGAEMFREWGLPYSIVKPIASHHSPSSSGGELGYIIHMADILARKSGYGLGLDDRFYEMDNKAVEVLGSEKEELKMIGDEIGVCVERVSKEVLDEPL
ncbi:MAG: HDOD domain-containing protein [Desulfatiglandaceae bacterium]